MFDHLFSKVGMCCCYHGIVEATYFPQRDAGANATLALLPECPQCFFPFHDFLMQSKVSNFFINSYTKIRDPELAL